MLRKNPITAVMVTPETIDTGAVIAAFFTSSDKSYERSQHLVDFSLRRIRKPTGCCIIIRLGESDEIFGTSQENHFFY